MINDRGVFPVAEDAPACEEQPLPRTLALCLWALIFTCFMLPGRDGPAAAGGVDWIAFLKLGTRTAVFLWLGISLMRQRRCLQRDRVVTYFAALGVFVCWAVLSCFWSALTYISLGQAFGLTVLFLMAVHISIGSRGERNICRLLWHLETGLLIWSTVILMINRFFPELGGLDRFNPGIVHPTTAAATASLGLVLLLASRLLWGWTWTRVQLWPGVVIYITLLLLAANRTTTFLSLVLLIGMVVAFSDRRVLSALLVLTSLGSGAYLTLDPNWTALESTAGVVFEHIQRGEYGSIQSFSGRTEMWETVWQSYLQAPWIGHGYFVTSPRGELFVWGVWLNWTAHNVFLQLLATTGLVGAMLLGCGLCVPLTQTLRWRATSQHHRRLARLILVLVVWYFVWGLFNESWLGPIEPESVIFWAMLGLAVGMVPRLTERSRSHEMRAHSDSEAFSTLIPG